MKRIPRAKCFSKGDRIYVQAQQVWIILVAFVILSAAAEIHDFDIYDKHKLLLPAVSILDSGKISPVPVAGKKAIFDGQAILFEFIDGAEIARFKVRVPEEMMDMNYSVTLNVIFEGQPGPLFVIPTLKRVIEVVKGVGASFLPLF